MDDFSSNDYLKAVIQALQRRIEKLEKSVNSENESLKALKTKKGIINSANKILTKAELKKLSKKLSDYRLLDKSLDDMKFTGHKSVEFPNTLIKEFQTLCGLITAEEAQILNTKLNSSAKAVNKEHLEETEKKVEIIQKLLTRLGIDSSMIFVKSVNQAQSKKITLVGAIKCVERIERTALSFDSVYLGKDQLEIDVSYPEEIMLKKLEELIKENKIEKNKNNEKTITDIAIVKELHEKKAKISKTLLVVSNLIGDLSKIDNFNSSEVITFLSKLQDKYEKTLDIVEKQLEKYDLTDLIIQCENIDIREARERQEQSEIDSIQSLSYELEKTMQEEPGNYEKIKTINEQIKNLNMHSGISITQKESALAKGKTQYHEKRIEKRIEKEAALSHIEKDQEQHRKEMQILRELAIKELEMSDAFGEEYEVRNGDVYSNSDKREKIIRNKMKELKEKFDSQKTPQISQDSKYSIRRDYIKYIAGLPDKKQGMSFEDYAKAIEERKNNEEMTIIEDDYYSGRGI